MMMSVPCGGMENNVSHCVTLLTFFWIIAGFGLGFIGNLETAMGETPTVTAPIDPDSHEFIPVPESRLTTRDHQQLSRIKPQFVTPFNSKENPGDRDTWYVIGFTDIAQAASKSREATMLAGGKILWSDQNTKQLKVSKDAVIAHGRTAAAQAVLQYTCSPNSAVAKLRVPSNQPREGWMKSQNTAVATDRRWVYRAFNRESQAREFLASVRSAK